MKWMARPCAILWHGLIKMPAKEDLTEICAAKQAEACRAASGKLLDLSFDTISGTGPNGSDCALSRDGKDQSPD